jgi:predicted O-linked N-acetylglucosamine transferase (SPINDLY family)
LHQVGKLAEAEATYRRVLASDPRNIQALHLLWAALSQQGNFSAALEAIESAVRLWPSDATLWHSLGTALMNVARNGDAEDAYLKARQMRPDFADAHFSLGYLLERTGRFSEAEQSLRQAVRLDPNDQLTLNHLGIVLLRLDRPSQAMTYFRRVLTLDPRSAQAHCNVGAALRQLGEHAAAMDSFRHALALNPTLSAAHAGMGEVLVDLGRPEEALERQREAVRLKPDSSRSHAALATALGLVGHLAEAEQSYRRALELEPDYREGHSNLIFLLDLMETTDVRTQQEERRRWYLQHAQKHESKAKPHRNNRDPDRKLRIGYVSADFKNHSAFHAIAPVICGHDRSDFEVFCYSGVKHEDDATARIRMAADAWRPMLGVADDELAEQIRRDGVDILVDLSGHSDGHRLLVFARKPAPVQVTAWGHATGTGLKTMDYLFSDPVIVPREQRTFFAEELVDLPCVLGYEAPEYMPAVSALPSTGGEPFTFGCVNRLQKITDRAIALWGRILASAPGARLLFKDGILDDASLRQRFLRRLQEVGGIASDRVVLLGRSAHAHHLATYQRVDIGLDPFPQNGGISTVEALYMGVPVVTLCGATVPSRLTASFLTGMQMQDWIAETDDDYVRIALQKKSDPGALATLRGQLRTRSAQSPFGDLAGYVRAVEQAYRAMWRRWCSSIR